MNILFLTNCMKQPDDVDKGITNVAYDFAKTWSEQGHKVIVIHFENKYPVFFYLFPKFVYDLLKKKQNITIPSYSSRKKLIRKDNDVLIVRYPITKIIPHTAFFQKQYKNQFNKIITLLKSNSFKPDVITGHWLEPQLKMVNDLGNYYGAKKGFVIHGELPNNLKDEYKNYIKHLDCFFFRSDSTLNKSINDSNLNYLSAKKTKVCYSGIPTSYVTGAILRTDWKSNNYLHVIFVGRLIAYKRVDSIIKALHVAFPNNNFTFDIVGDGSEMDRLKKMVDHYGVSKQVVFHGRVDRDDVQNLMKDADCFAMISENEVFGLVYLEAMANGCITIASKDGGVDGIIKNEFNGYLCSQGDYKELAKILKKINQMKSEEVLMIRQNALNTVKNFTDEKVAEKYLNNILYSGD